MARYLLLQYRDDLLSLQQDELAAQSQGGPIPNGGGLGNRRADKSRAMFSDAEKEQVAGDLLVILQTIPMAVIGESAAGVLSSTRLHTGRADRFQPSTIFRWLPKSVS
jgi:hypothetical protein